MSIIEQSGTVLKLTVCSGEERVRETNEQMLEIVPGLEEIQHELSDRYPELSMQASARILGLATTKNRKG